jgi:hypothetical protein
MRHAVLRFAPGLLFAVFGCAPASSLVAPLDLVPADAVAAVEFRWRDSRANPTLKQIAELPQSLAEVERLGVSMDAIESVVVFTRYLSSPGNETVLVSAPNLGSQFTAAAGANGWQTVLLNGDTVYFHPGHGNAAAAISDGLLVAGSRESVNQFARSRTTMGAFVSKAEFAGVREALADTSPVRFAVAWPTDVADSSRVAVAASAGLMKLAGWTSVGSIIERLGIGRACVVRLRPEGGGVRFNVAGVMQDEDTAATVAGGLSILKGLASLIPASARQGQSDPTATLTIERTGAVVRVGMVLPENVPRD